ncbi:protein kinase domain-containing protein [Pseudokineococcus sp. 1T1Z-3]|uniref:protein kinase domain-containing protein n=1 Tax=Pseudokineococcus sp. 1T1Z-3 TaxID=3132745 RepID=UPI0030ABDE97
MSDDGTGAPEAPPERVLADRYVLGEELGRGGMAVVLAAQDQVLGRQVAVKLLRADLARDATFQERFRREARSAAALNHPAVVGVHDVGEGALPPGHEPLPFIVMELVRGATVRELLDDRRRARGLPVSGAPEPTAAMGRRAPAGSTDATTRLAPGEDEQGQDEQGQDEQGQDEQGRGQGEQGEGQSDGEPGVGVDLAVTITAGVLSALAYSHRAGIVHRDIKPANVMLTPGGDVKVMDFGIARAMADTSVTATHTSTVLGTAQYLSPEQARGRPVDARTDLYSTGCLLHELLTGRPPFEGESAVSLAYQHVSETPEPPSAHHPGLPPALDGVVARALAKDPDDRYPDADAFRLDLLAAADGGASTAEVAAVAAATSAVAAPVPTSVPSGPVQLPPAAPEEEQEAPDRGRRAVVVLAALVALALVVAAAVLLPRLLADEEPVLTVVPDVVGETAAGAEATVVAAGLDFEATSAPSADVPEGRVVASDPAAGEEVEEGSAVEVTVSTGPESVTVPSVTGFTEARARAALEEVDLEVGDVSESPDQRQPEGAVISTDPGPGVTVAPGSSVDLVVSDGTVQIEDYVGLPVTTARSALISLGLTPTQDFVTTDEVAENVVVSQDPGAGPVPQGSTVTLVVAVPSPPTPEPTETETVPTPEPTETEPDTTTTAQPEGDRSSP